MKTKTLTTCFLAAALIILSLSGQAFAQDWRTIDFPGQANLTGVCFVHPDTGFVVSDFGEFGRTVDGGKTWALSRVTKGTALEDVSFLSGNLGFVCGRGSSIYRTIDGGFSWDNMTPDDTIPWFFDVEMLTGKIVVIVGATRSPNVPYEGLMLRSTDGGKSFEKQDGIGIGYKELFYRPGGPLYLLTIGRLCRSDDLGQSWETSLTSDGKPGRSLSIAGSSAVIAGPMGMVAYTADGGKTWRTNDRADTETLIAVEMVDEKTGYVGGHPEILIKTTDGGSTWSDEIRPAKFTVLDFCLIADRLYAVGTGGAMAVKLVK